MLPTFRTTTAMTLQDVANTAYLTRRQAGGDVDPVLEVEVLERLTLANDAFDDTKADEVVRLPGHPGAPYAVYAIPGTTLDAGLVSTLSASGYRTLVSVRALARSSRLESVVSSSQARSLITRLGNLLRIPEIGLGLVVELPVETVEDFLADTAWESLLSPFEHPANENATPTLAQLIRIRAADLRTKSVLDPMLLLSTPVSAEELGRLASVWERKARSTRRNLEERSSATAIAAVYRMGQAYTEGSRAVLRHRSVEGRAGYDKLYRLQMVAGKAAPSAAPLEERLTVGDAVDASHLLLADIDTSDIEVAREEAGLRSKPQWASVSSFSMEDLVVTDRQQLADDLAVSSTVRPGDLHRSFAEGLQRTYSNTKVEQLSWIPQHELNTTTEGQAFIHALDEPDRHVVATYFRASNFSAFSATAILANGSRFSMAKAASTTGFPAVSSSAVRPDVLARLPSGLRATVSVTDVFCVIEKGKAAGGVVRSKFSTDYETEIAAKLLTGASSAELVPTREDFLDPGRLALLLPLWTAKHCLIGEARMAQMAGRSAQASAIRQVSAGEPMRDGGSQTVKWYPDLTMKYAASYASSGGHVEMSQAEVEDELADLLAEGHSLYRAERYAEAADTYREAIDFGEQLEPVLVEAAGAAVDQMIGMAASGALPEYRLETLRNLVVMDGGTPRRFFAEAKGLVAPDALVSGPARIISNAPFGGVELQSASSSCYVPQDDEASGNAGSLTNLYIAEALFYQRQLEAGLNFLGFDNQMLPAWSFEALLQQARRLSGVANGWQQRAMSLLEASEDAYINQLRGDHAADAADAGVKIAKAGEVAARSRLDMALQAETQFGLSSAFAWTAAAANFAVAQPEVQGAGFFALLTQMNQMGDTMAALNSRSTSAASQLVIAGQVADLEQLKLDHAQALQDEVEAQDVDHAARLLLSRRFEPLAATMLAAANRLAWMAERSHIFETRLATDFIGMDYVDRTTLEGRFAGAAGLQADLEMLASHRLLTPTQPYQLIKRTVSLVDSFPAALAMLRHTGRAYIFLDLKSLDLQFPGLYLHQTRKIELEFDGVLPRSGATAMLHTSPFAKVRVPNSRVYVPPELAISDWAYEGTEGSPYVLMPVQSRMHTEIFSEYDAASDGFQLSHPPGALDGVRNIAPYGLFLLELPRTGNAFDLTQIEDVRLSFHFSAEHAPELADTQVRVLSDRAASPVVKARRFVGRNDSARSRRAFIDGHSNERHPDLRFFELELTPDQLQHGASERRLANVDLFLRGPVDDARVRLASTFAPFGGAADLNGGRAYSAIGDPSIVAPGTGQVWFEPRVGSPELIALVQRMESASVNSAATKWVVKVEPSLANNQLWLKNEDGQVVVDVVNTLQFDSDGTAEWSTEVLQNARIRVVGAPPFLVELTGVAVAILDTDGGDHRGVALLQSNVAFAEPITLDYTRRPVPTPDELYELELNVYGNTVEVWLDRVLVASKQLVGRGVSTGITVRGQPGTALHVVEIERLSASGRPVGTALVETWPDLGDWAVNGAHLASQSRRRLDLRSIEDVELALEYGVHPLRPVSLDVFTQNAPNGRGMQGPADHIHASGAVLVWAKLGELPEPGAWVLLRSFDDYNVQSPISVLQLEGEVGAPGVLAFETWTDEDAGARLEIDVPLPAHLDRWTLFYARWHDKRIEAGWVQGGASDARSVGDQTIVTGPTGPRTLFDGGSDGSLQAQGSMAFLRLDRRLHDEELAQIAADGSFVSLHYDAAVSFHPTAGKGVELGSEITDPSTQVADVSGGGFQSVGAGPSATVGTQS